MDWQELPFPAAAAAYAVASVLLGGLLLGSPPDSRRGRAGVAALVAALGLHAADIVATTLLSDRCPVRSVQFAASLAAWVLGASYLATLGRSRMRAVGAVVAPLCLALLLAARLVGERAPRIDANRALLSLHVTANLLGLALFVLAGVVSAFYLVQDARLRQKRPGGAAATRLPPLDSLDRVAFRLLLVGFPLLTLGVVSGSAFAGDVFDTVGGLLRAVLAWGSWLLLGAVLLARAVAGWGGRRAAIGAIVGASLVVLVFTLYALGVTVAAGGAS